jgi:hypothetical protein
MQHPGNSHFLMALGRHDAGGVVDTADEALREVIRAVLNTGKSGNVTIKMVVAKNGDKGLEVSCEVAAKAPRLAFGKAFYFTNGNDDLVRDAPRLNLEPTGPAVFKGGRDD